MSVSISQGEALVRKRTRHLSADDVRATTADIRGELNRAYRTLRLKLSRRVPQLYIKTSDDLELPEGEENTIELDETDCGNVSNIWRVDRFCSSPSPGIWRPLDRADEIDPSQTPSGNINFYRKGRCLVLGPDSYTGGTYRVLFHVVPNELTGTDPNELFLLPDELDDPLVLLASAPILLNDGDLSDAEKLEAMSEKKFDAAVFELRQQYGLHQKRAGLRMVRSAP